MQASEIPENGTTKQVKVSSEPSRTQGSRSLSTLDFTKKHFIAHLLIFFSTSFTSALFFYIILLFVQNHELDYEWITALATLLLTIVTTTLAIVTYGLFSKTADMATTTQDTLKEARIESAKADDRQKKSLSGILAINNFKLSFDEAHENRYLGVAVNENTYSQNINLTGSVRNVGFGPALDATIKIELSAIPCSGGERPLSWTWPIGTWNAGDSYQLGTVHGTFATEMNVHNLTRPLITDDFRNMITTLSWTTIFGTSGTETTTSADGRSVTVQRIQPI